MSVIYEKIAIIGIGLIGASIALAARRGNLVTQIVGCDADAGALDTVRKLALVDQAVTDPLEAVADADLVVMAVPVGAMGVLAARIVPAMKPGAVLTAEDSERLVFFERMFFLLDVEALD